jgi:hypothetical protein
MDLDSDSDDDLLLQAPSVLKKPSRAETRQAIKAESYLQDIFAESERQAEQTRLLSQIIKREQDSEINCNDNEFENDENWMQRSLQLSKEAALNSKSSNLVRQREMEDVLHGILEDDQVLSREERIKRQRAITTDLTFQLGLRSQILSFDPQRGDLVAFEDEVEAKHALQKILNECTESESYVESMRRACEENCIFFYLNRNRYFRNQLAEGLIAKENPALVQWLYSVAISPHVSNLIFEKSLWALLSKENQPHGSDLKTFAKSLKSWVAPDPSQNEKPRKNVNGLSNFLVVWEQILTHSPKIDESHESTVLELLSTLLRISLDESTGLHDESKTNDRGIERTIFEQLQHLFTILIEKTLSNYKNPSQAVKWMQTIADTVIDALEGDLGPSPVNSENDPNAWLVYYAALRIFPIYKKGTAGCSVVEQTKTLVAVKIIACLLAWENIDGKVSNRLHELEMASIAQLTTDSLCWMAISVAYLGLVEVDLHGDNIAKDHSKTLATLRCLEMAYECGLHLLEDASSTECGAEYGSKEQAELLLEVVVPMDKIVSQMSTRLRKLATNTFIERADYFLMIFHHYNFHILNKITKRADVELDEMHVKKKQQTTMSSFFAVKSLST